MNILEIKDLNMGFRFERGFQPVLYDISLSLKKKSTLAIVGESGSGKTLTAMSVLRLLPKNALITGGEINYGSHNLLNKCEKDMQKIRGKKIALIPQDPMSSLNPLYTVGNQLLEVIELHQGLTGEEAKKVAIDALKQVKIPNAEQRMNAYPHEFSGGMKQRVIIAMALACQADIILADEPTTALDVTVQAQIMKLLQEIKENHSTSIILITHDLGLVAENADEIAVMYAGRIVEYSQNSELFKNPKHPYTKALLKAVPDVHAGSLEIIEGQPPSISDEIPGCRFHPRCKNRIDRCSKEIPCLEEINTKSKAACFNR